MQERSLSKQRTAAPPDAVVVTGLGMITALGRGVVASCAAARAGLSRAAGLDYEVLDEETLEMEPLQGHVVQGYADGFAGFGRLVRLGAAALRDLIQYSGLTEAAWGRTAAFIHLTDDYYADEHFMREQEDGLEEADALPTLAHIRKQERDQERLRLRQSLIPRLFSANGLSAQPQSQDCTFGGPAEFMNLVKHAFALLQQGTVERCVIGGIDSLVEPKCMEPLQALNLLRAPAHPEGFIPGEAAALILLERYQTARARQGRIQARLDAPETGRDPVHRFSKQVPTGRGLYQAIAASFAAATPPPPAIGLAIGNLNGDVWRAKEYGLALMRMSQAGFSNIQEHWFPALGFGETGAATGAAALCCAVRALARGYAGGPDVLVWLMSDGGGRAACLVRSTIA